MRLGCSRPSGGRAGGSTHAGVVEAVDGTKIIVQLTSNPGRGRRGLLFAHEVIEVRNDAEAAR